MSKKYTRPLRSKKEQIKQALKSGRYFMRYAVDSNTRKKMQEIVSAAKRGYDSKKLYSKNGKYTPSRKRIHNKIIRYFLRMDTKTKSPDIYVFGGPAGSGKTSTLARFVRERTITVNNDDIKKKLTKYDPSPIKRFPLIHAAFLHEESSDIEKELIDRAIRQKKDIILDRTLANYQKNRKLLRDAKKKGYRITVLGTNLPPHIALIRAASRFIKKGRYVPLDIIAKKGNQTNASVMKMAKQKFVKKSRVYNTTKTKPKLMYKKR